MSCAAEGETDMRSEMKNRDNTRSGGSFRSESRLEPERFLLWRWCCSKVLKC